MKVITMEVGPLAANCYILYCQNTKKAAIIDPGAEGELIISQVKSNRLEIQYILLTHGHFDHIGAVKYLKDELNARVAIHVEDAGCLNDNGRNLSLYMRMDIGDQGPADKVLKDGDKLHVGDIELKVLHTPGHSGGSVCFLAPGAVFTGDTLFCGSVGRSDFPGGNCKELIRSIIEKLMVLDDNFIIYPGHGPASTIGRERITIPYIAYYYSR